MSTGTPSPPRSPELDPARTLVLVASKSFTTQETATNAAPLRAWIARRAGRGGGGRAFRGPVDQPESGRRLRHPARARLRLPRLGRRAVFAVVAGRARRSRSPPGGTSSRRCWTAPGRWTAISATRRCAQNLPVLLALAGVWHVNALGCATQCVLAYDERLRRLPAHLQQVEMESNGKRVALDGSLAEQATAPVIFGEPGTSAQHSFMQLVHQGTGGDPGGFHPRRRRPTTTGRRRTARSPPTPSPRPRRCCAAVTRRRCGRR